MGPVEAIATAPAAQFGIALAVAALAALAAFVTGFVCLYRARVIEDTPTARIRSAPQGYVELEGVMRMMPGEPVISPLSARRCCWWRYKVEQKRTRHRNGKRETRWVTVDQDSSSALFLLSDETGECCVDPVGATVLPSERNVWYGHARRPDVGPAVGRGFWRSAFCRYRYTEEVLHAGRPIYAIGLFRTHGGHGEPVDLAAQTRELLAKWKQDPKMMALFDVNKDGQVDVREWDAARRLAEQRAAAAVIDAGPLPDTHLLSKPPGRRPYLLSALTQAQLIRRYRLRGWVALAGFLLLLGGCLWALQIRGLI